MSGAPSGSSTTMETFEVSSRDNVADHHEMNLPPVDRGRRAWLFLAACFIIEALIWGMLKNILQFCLYQMFNFGYLGFTFSFGIFQDYYSTHEPFKSSGDTAVDGTCAMVRFLLLRSIGRLILKYYRVSRICYFQWLSFYCKPFLVSSYGPRQ
jgi:hypothetical protein